METLTTLIHDFRDGDIFVIEPETPYPSSDDIYKGDAEKNERKHAAWIES